MDHDGPLNTEKRGDLITQICGLRWESDEANARLIAAAPEMPHYCEYENCTGGRLMRELESLTPGGSEYVGDVGRCIEAIKDSREMDGKIIAKLCDSMNELRHINAELLEALQQAAFAIPTTHAAFETVRAAIAKYGTTEDQTSPATSAARKAQDALNAAQRALAVQLDAHRYDGNPEPWLQHMREAQGAMSRALAALTNFRQ